MRKAKKGWTAAKIVRRLECLEKSYDANLAEWVKRGNQSAYNACLYRRDLLRVILDEISE